MALFDYDKTARCDRRGPLYTVVSSVYGQLDAIPPPLVVRCPEGLREIVRFVYDGHGISHPEFESMSCAFDRPEKASSEKVAVAFTGGVDSLAAALKMEISGLTPVLYHVRKINRAYPKECQFAEVLATKLGFEFIDCVFTSAQKSAYAEHPMKDQLIVSSMVDYGASVGILKFTSGNHSTNLMSESNVLYNWSDASEMYEGLNRWISSMFPEFQWIWSIKNRTESLKLIFEKDVSLLGCTMSCMTPHRFQGLRRKQIEQKFGVEIPGHRCGYCWKCCSDYLHFVCLGLVASHKGLIDHCLMKFRDSLPIVYGTSKLGLDDSGLVDLIIDRSILDNSRVVGFLS